MSFAADLIGADLDVFINASEFARAAIFAPQGGSASAFNVIFTESFQMLNPVTGNVESTAPQALVKTASVPDVIQGDYLTIAGIIYVVREVQPGSSGLTLLLLSKEELHG